MQLTESESIRMYCQNCGNKVVGYRSGDQTVRVVCNRCGARYVSKKMNKRTIETRMTAPPKRELIF
jgi:ribosomal protein S27E